MVRKKEIVIQKKTLHKIMTQQKTTFGYKANKIPNLLFQNKPKCNYRKDQLQQNNTNERKINETD